MAEAAAPATGTLSVITPTMNAREYLGENLASVAALAIPHEHIVVDGGSDDGTVELLRSHRDAALSWVSEADRGQTHAVNKGLAMASGEYLAWLNGDDAYIADAVEQAVAVLEQDQGVDAIYGYMVIVDRTGSPIRTYRCGPFSWRRYLYLGGYIPTPTIIFRRELLRRAPKLDERYVDAADYDFYLRLLRGARVRRLRTPLVRFRYHPDSKTASRVELQLREGMRIRLGAARNPVERTLIRALGAVRRARDRIFPPWPDADPSEGA